MPTIVESLEGFEDFSDNRLYYGYTTVADIPLTRISPLSGIKKVMNNHFSAFYEDAVGRKQIDSANLTRVEHAQQRKSVASLSHAHIEMAQEAVVRLSKGEEISVEAMTVLDRIMDFADHCNFTTQGGYYDIDSKLITGTINAFGLDLEQDYHDFMHGPDLDQSDEKCAFGDYIYDQIIDPVFGDAAILRMNGKGLEPEYLDRRRRVAASCVLQRVSCAIVSLKAATEFGAELEGLVAERLDRLVRI